MAERHSKRLERLVGKEEKKDVNANETTPKRPKIEPKEEESKYYTKRPPVERLNPDLVNKVEKIVAGELVREKVDDRGKKAQRLDRNGLQAMEQRLMEAGMQKSKTENMTSQEEKVTEGRTVLVQSISKVTKR